MKYAVLTTVECGRVQPQHQDKEYQSKFRLQYCARSNLINCNLSRIFNTTLTRCQAFADSDGVRKACLLDAYGALFLCSPYTPQYKGPHWALCTQINIT